MKGKYPNRLQEAMDEAGLGPTALGRLAGTSKQNIDRWADGSRKLTQVWAHKLARHLPFEAAELLFLIERRPVRVPLLSWVSAGKLVDPGEPIPASEDVKRIGVGDLGPGDWFSLKVQGDSMDRISPPGSVIIINRREKDLIEGKPYVFTLRGESTFKVWGSKPPRMEPFSTNPANKTLFFETEEELNIIGRVRRTLLDL